MPESMHKLCDLFRGKTKTKHPVNFTGLVEVLFLFLFSLCNKRTTVNEVME